MVFTQIEMKSDRTGKSSGDFMIPLGFKLNFTCQRNKLPVTRERTELTHKG
jgi:hypothetical protein